MNKLKKLCLVRHDSVGSDEANDGPSSVSKQHVFVEVFKFNFGLAHHNKGLKYDCLMKKYSLTLSFIASSYNPPHFLKISHNFSKRGGRSSTFFRS